MFSEWMKSVQKQSGAWKTINMISLLDSSEAKYKHKRALRKRNRHWAQQEQNFKSTTKRYLGSTSHNQHKLSKSQELSGLVENFWLTKSIYLLLDKNVKIPTLEEKIIALKKNKN